MIIVHMVRNQCVYLKANSSNYFNASSYPNVWEDIAIIKEYFFSIKLKGNGATLSLYGITNCLMIMKLNVLLDVFQNVK